MKKVIYRRRGLGQLFAITVLPLSILLVLIVFWSFRMHQQNMRTLVGERDQRAIRSAAIALESELDKRANAVSDLALLANYFPSNSFDNLTKKAAAISAGFNGGFAFF